jgi:hypothetical protein
VALASGAADASSFTSGVGLRVSNGTGNVWTLYHRNAGVDTATGVGALASATTGWQWIRLVFSPAGAAAYVGATRAAALASTPSTIAIGSLTTAVTLGPLFKIRQVAGTTNRMVAIELFVNDFTLTTPR